MSWYLMVLRKYAVFQGRARRKEFWYFLLFNYLVYFVLVMIDRAAEFSGLTIGHGPLSFLYSLAVFIPEIAVTARRLHDTNHSGWWQLMLVPIVVVPWLRGTKDGEFLILVLAISTLLCVLVLLLWQVRDSDPDENRWGPNPKGESEARSFAASRS